VGVTDGAKKPEGYVSVMVPPAGTGFAAVNPSVTDTDVARFAIVCRNDEMHVGNGKN
jgi:hypothetical protein